MEFLLQTSLPYILQIMIYVYTITNLFSSPYCQDRGQWTLCYFLFSLYFTFLFFFLFNFLFLEQLGLGVISHAVTSVTN